MSVTHDLLELNMTYPDGDNIYYDDDHRSDYQREMNGITVVKRNPRDQDPEITNGYPSDYAASVIVEINGHFFKSHEVEGSLGRDSWTPWKEVHPKTKIFYEYESESSY